LIALAQNLAGPLAPGVVLLFAGLAQILVLALCLMLPDRPLAAPRAAAPAHVDGTYLWATAASFFAWLGMAVMMAGSPGLMAHCGIGLGGRTEVISWHILAMYAPAALLGFLPNPRGEVLCAVGLAIIAGAIAILTRLTGFIDFGVTLIVAGCGWSLAMFGATLMLHAKGPLARPLLALHDAAMFSGAILGALGAAFLH